jgi:large subunit ribosomal protein L9
MEVILREDVLHLGHIGDVVRVKPGFARNFLLPRGLAVVADKRNLGQLEHERRVAAAKRERALTVSRSLAEKLAGTRVTIKARAGDEGKLYGSVTNIDVERALADQGVTVERRRIRLDEPIRSLGEHPVTIHLSVGVNATVTVVVEAIASAEKPAEE